MQPVMPDALSEGRFQLLEVIGEGGMATVYRAFDQRLQRPRAIKVLSPALAARPSLRKRFLSEAQTMANLEESRVVRIFDMGEDGDRVFIVMELVDGGSLLDRVTDFGPLPPRMAAEATIQICESLQAAHDAGVIHRDIKPHNILLTRAGEIRVTDFGIAQVQTEDGDGMTRTGAVMGTWGFMAPEQKSNAKQVDARADVYSVGATLWSLLRGETPPELFMADNEPGMLADIPEELAEVIKRATRYRREERYVTARAMADSLRAFLPMLPEDPELTVPLVPPVMERRPRNMDTMQQFASEHAPGAMETMVPTIGERPEAEPTPTPTPRPVLISGKAAVPRPATTFHDDAPKAGKIVGGLLLLAIPGVLLLVAVVVGAFLFWPGNPEPPKAPVATAPVQPAPVAPAVIPPTEAPVPSAPVVEPAPVAAPAPTGPRPAPHAGSTAPAPVTAPAAPVAAPAAPIVAPAAPVEPAPAAAVAPAADKPLGLTHTPPPPVHPGETVTFRASIPGTWSVKLYYRPATGGAYQSKTMAGDGGTYTTTVKVGDDLTSGIEYFISATGDKGTVKEGSPTGPRRVQVIAVP